MLPFFSFLLFYDCPLFWYQRFNPHAYWYCHFLVFSCVLQRAVVEKEDIVKWLNHNIAYSRKHQMGWNRAQSLFFEINQRGVKVLFWTTFLHWQNGLSTVAVILEARSRQVWLLPNEVTHVATRWLVFFFTSFLDIRVLDNKQLNAVKSYDVIGILSLKATAITLVSIVSRWVRG